MRQSFPLASLFISAFASLAGAQQTVTVNNGTANAVAKYTGTSTIGPSAIIEGGGKVGIGVYPNEALDVAGRIVQRAAAAGDVSNYLNTNYNGVMDKVLLNPGLNLYGGAHNPNGGIDLGWNSIRQNWRTRIFASRNWDVALSYTRGDATSQADFTDGLVLRGDSGNVGISTPDPQNALSVVGGLNIDQDDDADGQITPAGSGNWLTFGHSSGEGIASPRIQGSANQYGLDFFTGFAKRLSITSAGRVGIGTTSPSEALEVNGNVKLVGSGAGLVFPDGSVQRSAANASTASTTTTGTTTTILNSAGTAGFQFATTAQIVGGAFGPSGSLQFQANSVTDATGTGGVMFLGGNARGDGQAGKAWMTGNSTPGMIPSTVALLVNAANNVGIGLNPLSDPQARLEVNGSVVLTANSGASLTFPDTSVQSTAWNGVLSGGDYAESVNVSGQREQYEPGDVLVIDTAAEGNFLKSATPYSTAVTGIYSTKPGVVGRRQLSAKAHMIEEVPMAMTGIVPTKVSAENGSIKPGDLLVTSSKNGYAMKGTDRSRMLGAVIGKAIGHLDRGTGVIEAVVTLQ